MILRDSERLAPENVPQCRAMHPDEWLCCREEGHPGDHIAWDLDEPFLRWKRTTRDGGDR